MVLEKLNDIYARAIEHAGLKSLLILLQGDELIVEAEASTGGNESTVHRRDATVSPAESGPFRT